MTDIMENISIADILGPWIEPDWDSGLIDRLREAWNKPLQDLSREELATLLRQRYAVEKILPVARKKLADGIDDETEIFDRELHEAIEDASKAI
jgi:hypothetical protein